MSNSPSDARKQLLLWSIVCAVCALGVVLFALQPTQSTAPANEWQGGLVFAALLTAGFIAFELLVVHVHFGKNTHSFSLMEIPLVIGLLLAPPVAVVLAYVLGSGMVLLRRRQPAIKLAFNAGSFCLTASLAGLLYHALAGGAMPTDVVAWVGVTIATCTATVLGALLVSAMVSIVEWRLSWNRLFSAVGFALTVTGAATSIGISGAILIDAMPLSMIFLAVPVVALYFANRAYVAELQRRQSLDLLYDASRGLSNEPELETGVFATLRRLQDALGTDVVEVLLATEGSGACTRLRILGHGTPEHIPGVAIEEMFDHLVRCGLSLGRIEDLRREHPSGRVLLESTANLHYNDETMLVAALADMDGLLGVIAARKTRRSTRQFSGDDIGTFQAISRNVAAHLRLAHQATHDALTGLPNRRLLERKMQAAFADARSATATLLLLDIDDFKAVNDTFGHGVGDDLLVRFGARLSNIMAQSAMVSRLGGDEFAVFSDSGERTWEDIVEAAVRALSEPVVCGEHSFTVKSSMGVALGAQADDHVALYRNADTALYEAKRSGKAQYQLFAQTMHARVVRRYHIAVDLAEALDRGDLRIVLQPIVDVRSSEVVGAEVLARWRHNVFGELSPSEFVPIAEEYGLSTKLSRFVVGEAYTLLGLLPELRYISVNVSPIDLRDTSFIDFVILRAGTKESATLAIEVTERSIVGDTVQLQNIRRLRDSDVPVFIDDFGTQYSSLSYLKDIPADCLKIPKEFTDQLETGDAAIALIRAVIAIAHAFGMTVVAEGIESIGQVNLLKSLGCEYAQGYFYGRPQEVDDFMGVAALRAA